MRDVFDFPPVRISHVIEPPIGSGFGTSGSGALGAAIALMDLFKLKMTLAEVSAFAHRAEVENLTGLGTVISLASGSGAVGLVTEPGSYSFGVVDSLIVDPSDYLLVCGWFGPIEKSSILRNETARKKVNAHGSKTLAAVLENPTPTNLMRQSRLFAERSKIGAQALLKLCDKAIEIGALGATQNMIGNAIHCLVRKDETRLFTKAFRKYIPANSIFMTELIHGGPTFI
jgi:pantoate kinase